MGTTDGMERSADRAATTDEAGDRTDRVPQAPPPARRPNRRQNGSRTSGGRTVPGAIRSYSRGYLPHIDVPGRPVFVTFGLAAALPGGAYQRWCEELEAMPPDERRRELFRRVELAWDREPQSSLLGKRQIAALVKASILHGAEKEYRLHAWVVMPSHVHLLLTIFRGKSSLADVMQAMKGASSHAINDATGTTGRVWLPESFNRVIRGPEHFFAVRDHILRNPVAAGLCHRPEDWAWSSAAQAGAPAVHAGGGAGSEAVDVSCVAESSNSAPC